MHQTYYVFLEIEKFLENFNYKWNSFKVIFVKLLCVVKNLYLSFWISRMKSIYKFIFLSLITSILLGQGRSAINPSEISGTVIESSENVPMEFANVVLFNKSDSSQVTGTVTNSSGRFSLTGISPGNYYATFSYIGFKSKTIDNLSFSGGEKIAVGEIFLDPKTYDVDGVVVEGQRAAISYEIDKKVINVSEQLTSSSGTAVDVLENVPSVTVDIEGNVSLRGSGNFTVLVDGRPSILESNEALQQIPASSIENIEIITNPSAKFDPEGTAGIINVVMKKNKQGGMSGTVNLNGGLKEKYGGELLLNYKTKPYEATFGIDFTNQFYDADNLSENRTTFQGLTSFVNSDGISNRGRTGYGLRGELVFNIGESDFLTLGGRYGDRSFQSNSNQNYSEWSSQQPLSTLYSSTIRRKRAGDYYSLNTSYKHQFSGKGHELYSEIYYRFRNGDEETFNELSDLITGPTNGRRTTESGPGSNLRAKIDYSVPFSGGSKLETGYQSDFDNSEDLTALYQLDPSSGSYVNLTEFSNSTTYNRNIHSLYTLFKNDVDNFGYQFGLRGEYTDRKIELVNSPEKFTIDRWDYFPTAHFSYKFEGNEQIMASYTRRINRPRGWELEPFDTWMDAYSLRRGNPSLKPEYIDSYELGFQTILGASVFSLEGYYKINNNKVERIRSVYDDNITLETVENVGTDYSLGGEMMINFDPLKFWNVNLMGNVYNYRIEGVVDNQDFSSQSFNWNTRFNNILKLGELTQLQFNVIYNSPSVFSQGTREGYFTANLALRHDFFNKFLTAILQIRDVFNSARYEYTSTADNYFNYSYYNMDAPVVMLNLRFNINNLKQDKGGRGEDGGMSDYGGDDF